MSEIVNSEVRIILLYCTQEEAKLILANGAKAGLNTSNYLWIVTQSVVGDPSEKMMGLGDSFQIGMLGIHFAPNLDTIPKDIMPQAVRVRGEKLRFTVSYWSICSSQVFAEGALSFLDKTRGNLNYDLSCDSNSTNWEWGKHFFRSFSVARSQTS